MPKAILPSGHTWAYVDANPQGSPAILCLHGFPDLGYGYRHQIGAWARSGFRVIVPDMLGYGGSSAPIDPAQYTTKRLARDLTALLTKLGIARAVVVGHDWGSFTAGRVALWHPDRVLALVLMSVPYTPPALAPMTIADVAARAPNLGYQLFLVSPEAAPTLEANMPYFIAITFHTPDAGADVDFTPKNAFRTMLASPPSPATIDAMPCVLKGDSLRAYTAALRARGMTASPPTLDVLSIYGKRDASIAPAALKMQRRFVPRLTEVPLDGSGHWVMLEGVGEEPPVPIGNNADPLEEWREGMSAGAWKDGSGDGGVVGRTVLTWLRELRNYGRHSGGEGETVGCLSYIILTRTKTCIDTAVI
ncbi:Epoxide hydrolase hydrolase [Mycena sanguinolenta]|uniref:Epoxide hydrolase hydrolase n=1 Tax=Mycena sanguinolenta TaxID=230812 RepID=A0A8H7CZ70_9AGAR|nr:Epoxide hydrolase hydrolase [Mycena sanguinolenta]